MEVQAQAPYQSSFPDVTPAPAALAKRTGVTGQSACPAFFAFVRLRVHARQYLVLYIFWLISASALVVIVDSPNWVVDCSWFPLSKLRAFPSIEPSRQNTCLTISHHEEKGKHLPSLSIEHADIGIGALNGSIRLRQNIHALAHLVSYLAHSVRASTKRWS